MFSCFHEFFEHFTLGNKRPKIRIDHILVRRVKRVRKHCSNKRSVFNFFPEHKPVQAAQTKHVNRYNVNQITINLYEVYKTPHKLIS